ncbi:MAG: 2-C-methyl-D-erythritol 4-phosphate cytidylyltransferase [Bacteroidales bacterium]|nr:2-C-methyl-D-erythritol 4-phosphate cytidylyltransferase [Bacteroidales bacterium]
MKNIAMILAGGSGTRIGGEIPKQFLEVGGKPILAYTMERFQNHLHIDSIIVVCVEGWEDKVWEIATYYGIGKLSSVVAGGNSALSSIRKGAEALLCDDDDIVIVHDGVRPLVDDNSIDNVIEDCRKFGGAISAVPLIEHVVYVGKERSDVRYIPRENAFRTITPQAYRYSLMMDAFRKSEASGKGASSPFIGTLMMDLGEPVVLSKGSEKNIKITEPKDLVYFKTML